MIPFVTTLTNSYVPGLIALLQSMNERAGIEFVMTVVTYDNIHPDSMLRIRDMADIEFVDVRDLGTIPKPRTQTERMIPNLNKPLIWRLNQRGPLVYVDSDMLCLRPLHGIEKFGELTVVHKQTTIAAVKTRGNKYEFQRRRLNRDKDYLPSNLQPWNAGWFVFEPCEETFLGIAAQAASYKKPIHYGDQVILVDYFNRRRPERVHYADISWNTSTWIWRKFPQVFALCEPKFLHFAHDQKPWKDTNIKPWQQPFWDLWQQFYERSNG